MRARIEVDGTEVITDLARPIVIAIELHFGTAPSAGDDPPASIQPRHFGAPAATSTAFAVPGFSGSVSNGASCNCNVVTLTPHCNGTHTECVGHLTAEALDAHRVIPAGLTPALLVSIEPAPALRQSETTDPAPEPNDTLITRHAIESSWPGKLPFNPRALIIRTLPNEPDKTFRDYSNQTPPYLSREAADYLVERGIEHIVCDLPSIDRAHDEGRLRAHRIFFGLPPGSRALQESRRPRATITELAFIPNTAKDGPYLLEIQAPAIDGDAVPSRPLLYTLEHT